jgi:hypothetical protein
MAGKPGKESRERTKTMKSQPLQDSYGSSARKGQPWQDKTEESYCQLLFNMTT